MAKLIFAACLSWAVFCCSPEKRDAPASETPASAQVNEYPDLTLVTTDGSSIAAKNLEGNNVFIFFQPDCEHCQQEAVAIEENLEAFKDYKLYFISSAPVEAITEFARNYGLDNRDKVKFASTGTDGVLNHYGPIRTPSVYIYSEGRMKQSFNGQTEIDNILKAL